MVPKGGERFILVTDGPALGTIKSSNPSVAEAAVVPSRYREPLLCIRGKSVGRTRMVFNDTAGSDVGILDVGVFPKVRRSARFFLVKDTKHRTKTERADVLKWVATTNQRILGPQANVFFDVKSVEPRRLKRDLGSPIKFRDFDIFVPNTAEHKNWHEITAPGDLNDKVFNVFCVWDFILPGRKWAGFVAAKKPVTAENMAKAGLNANMCIIKDEVARDPATVFAHEAVHYLSRHVGIQHTTAKHRLMGEEGQTHPGRLLTRTEIEAIHKWSAMMM
jgi:hypothetical protein